MNLSMQINSGIRQEQNLSIQAIQSAELLQKTTQELQVAIEKELEENPLLEMDDSGDYSSEEEGKGKEDSEFPEGESSLTEVGAEEYPKEDWDGLLDSSLGDAEKPLKDLNAPDPEKEEWKNQYKSVASMQDKLREQLVDWNLSKEVLELVEYLIDSLDEKGYLSAEALESIDDLNSGNLSQEILEIEDIILGKKDLESARDNVKKAFRVLHSLKPYGIGARNLRECLLIQAYAKEDFSELSIRILEHEFDNLSTLKYKVIAKNLSVTLDEVQVAVKHLSTLSPHPGFLISETPVAVITPDLEVIEEPKGVYKASLLKAARFSRRLKISSSYKIYLNDPSKEVKDFITERLSKAKNLINNVNYRESTIEKVMQKIIEKQPDFFAKGPRFLKPMKLQEVGDSLNLHESTISRTVNGKYVVTEYGTFELRYFFSSGVRQEGNEELAQQQILQALKELIDSEDKKHPLSDDALSKALKEQGIDIARRTVAKYREEKLRILSARDRRNIGT